jgi:serine O-acetyltransferase
LIFGYDKIDPKLYFGSVYMKRVIYFILYFIALYLKAFGVSYWSLRERVKHTRSPLLKNVFFIIYESLQNINNCSISSIASIDGEPCLPHGLQGIFISRGARIGKNCIIFQEVTIGSNTLLDSKGIGAPTIGDDCYISAGAKIIGNVKVGNNVRIGANAVVYRNVPDNSIVVTGEQNNITKDYPLDNRFFIIDIRNGKWTCFDHGVWHTVEDEDIIDTLNDESISNTNWGN